MLRERIGSADFFRLMRRWAAVHHEANVGTRQFIALAERVSGQDLGTLFDDWLFTASKPTGY